MLTVKGWRLLVRPIKVVDSMQSQVPDDLKNMGFVVSVGDERTALMYEAGVERGVVVQVGNMAYKTDECGYGKDGWEPWCKEGDQITFVKYAGRPQIDPETGEEFLVLNDVDMLALVENA